MERLLSDKAQPPHLLQQTVGNILKAGLHRPMPSHNHDVVTQSKGILREPVGLSDSAADPVSHHGMAELCTGSQPQTVVGKTIFSAINHQLMASGAFALLVQTAKQMILFE